MKISYLADQLTRKIATLKLQISVLQDEIIQCERDLQTAKNRHRPLRASTRRARLKPARKT
jgi:uncharacterized coiled-coil DUF342 family protein